jgi:hypothetical protein
VYSGIDLRRRPARHVEKSGAIVRSAGDWHRESLRSKSVRDINGAVARCDGNWNIRLSQQYPANESRDDVEAFSGTLGPELLERRGRRLRAVGGRENETAIRDHFGGPKFGQGQSRYGFLSGDSCPPGGPKRWPAKACGNGVGSTKLTVNFLFASCDNR